MIILMKLGEALINNGLVFGANPANFITTWRTTTANESVTLPANGTNDVIIDWGDGSTETVTTANPSHTYLTAGDYDVSINGTMTSWKQNNQGDKDKLIAIKNWGTNEWQSLQAAFYGCSNMTCTATDILHTSNVTSMKNMFRMCVLFNGDVSNFDTSQVTSMYAMFYGCSSFNQSVSNFDTSQVTSMYAMFYGCSSFNQSVSNFNTSNVTITQAMFYQCNLFNQSVSNFDTTKVTNMASMFFQCNLFNQSVSNFDTSSVTRMDNMFRECSAFNQSVSNFDTSQVTSMYSMFLNCHSFNQDISIFNISSLTTAKLILDGSALDTTNYDLLLVAWNNQTHNSNVALGVGTTQYEPGDPATARTDLVNDGWTITDGGQALPQFITTWRTTTANESVTLPANRINNITINWGDGSTETVTTANPSHTYSTAGDYDVSIDGTMTSWHQANAGDKDKLIEIKNWGTNEWQSLQAAFYGCSNMTCTATDILHTSNVTDMSYMFSRCPKFNGRVSSLDTSNVTNMKDMLSGCLVFNQSVSNFDTSNVTNMTSMFLFCNAFNQSVSNFDTSQVTNIGYMFGQCFEFNQSVFNFDTSNVTNMYRMFWSCRKFNQDLSNFDTSKVTDMGSMIRECYEFNQDISTFNISSLTDADNILAITAFSTTNYDKLLIAWNNQTHNSNVPLGVGITKFDSGNPTTARTDLVNDGWTITDGGQV